MGLQAFPIEVTDGTDVTFCEGSVPQSGSGDRKSAIADGLKDGCVGHTVTQCTVVNLLTLASCCVWNYVCEQT